MAIRKLRRMLKGFLDGATRPFGLRVIRVPRIPHKRAVSTPSQVDETSLVVELVGPSGVGKSTFLDHIRNTASEFDGYHLLTESIRLKRADPKRRRRTRRDSQWLDVLDALSRFENSKPIDPSRTEHEPPEKKRQVLEFEGELRSAIGTDTVVIDHSFICFFHPFLKHLHGSDRELFRAITGNRAVVVCIANPEFIVQRIRRRSALGRTQSFHANHTDEELLGKASNGNNSWLEHGDWLESVGVPVLRLDLGRPLEESKERLKEFVKSLS